MITQTEAKRLRKLGDKRTNTETSALEVFEFCADIPERYFLYVDSRRYNEGSRAVAGTTWAGETLGEFTFGREFRDNFGGIRVPCTLRAINNETYHGTYFKSAGDYARIKLAKKQRS